MFLIRLLMGPIALLISYSTAQFLKPPDIVLQASSLGGFRAFIPETCGIETFNFEWRRDPEEEWRGGLIPGPIGGFWTYEDPTAGLGFGDTLFYRAMIRLDGRGFRKPETPWLVTDLFDEFPPYPPPPPAPEGGCKKKKGNETEIEDLGTSSSTTTKPTTPSKPTTTTTTSKPTTTSTTEKTTTTTTTEKPTTDANNTTDPTTEAPDEKTTSKAEETTENPKDMVERIDNRNSDLTDDKNKPTETPAKATEPTTKKPDQPETNQIPDAIAKGVCQRPWLLEPSPFDTRTTALEKQSVRMQCEMAAYSNRYASIVEALNDELTELKKLNYAMVTRMQRLETILRGIPQPIGWV